ncbi:MAG: sigma-54-dependent transcriptional regulator [Dissulfurimicrobium sp.]|uniref:sigma-54-dependent transcriptional regulator n=1 Tax=Dissulfurimicrobium TaxID=1769732 RepID=UPI001EDB9B24|nr:sigma-54 dependent transcriptional regulator [Dissulfurimicrobium hydrothermale]UKL13761.1 sigma-54 dependent transcriptional regulator [Dissulfurimicrobium hydrothermale]
MSQGVFAAEAKQGGVLLVSFGDDEVRDMRDRLKGLGLDTVNAGDAAGAADVLRKARAVLVIIAHDPKRGINGIELLRALQDIYRGVGFILLARNAVIEDAVAAMQIGASDFLCQPVDMEAFVLAVKRALGRPSPVKLKGVGQKGAGCGLPAGNGNVVGSGDCHEIITANPRVKKILSQAANIAPSRVPVLIMGESGTGKELLARYIHRMSQRSGPFVAVNCAALPETLLESELFGHEKGAFSGAIYRRLGKFELANGGTLLLDEITEMAAQLQAKLLRVLQEGEVDRLGGTGPVKIDVRVVATTNRDVKSFISSGRFREDLYFRLNVISFKLPPLRERREDLLLLAGCFLRSFSEQYAKVGLEFAKDAIKAITSMQWPGNIRELRNAVERGVLLASGGVVTAADMFGDESDADVMIDTTAGGVSSSLDVVASQGEIVNLGVLEREMIKRALSKTAGNRTHAAKLLGISVRTLRNKLSEYRQMGVVL